MWIGGCFVVCGAAIDNRKNRWKCITAHKIFAVANAYSNDVKIKAKFQLNAM